MKKWLALLLAIVMMLSMTACNEDEPEAKTAAAVETDANVKALSQFIKVIPEPPFFDEEDWKLVTLENETEEVIDLAALMEQPLQWDLTQGGPAVLIVHSHATESYTNTEGYKASEEFRTRDTNYNMVSIGDYVGQLLTEAGIEVIHDRTLHDYPDYDSGYVKARASVEKYLEEYPSIRMVLDLHRDADTDDDGNWTTLLVDHNGDPTAQLMFVVTTGAEGFPHPNWRENMALAVKTQIQLEKHCPGICRPMIVRGERYNQDLCTGTLLVEMGTVTNSRQQALRAAKLLAQSVIDLSKGTVPQEDPVKES